MLKFSCSDGILIGFLTRRIPKAYDFVRIKKPFIAPIS